MSSVQIDGDAIRSIREEKGLTQLYLATVVGVTTDTISRWENRKYPSIKFENAEKLAQALEVDLEDIVDSGAKNNEILVEQTGTEVSSSQEREAEPFKEKIEDALPFIKGQHSSSVHFPKRLMLFSGIIVSLLCLIALLIGLNSEQERRYGLLKDYSRSHCSRPHRP